MSQRYDSPPTLHRREVGDLSIVPRDVTASLDSTADQPEGTAADRRGETDPVSADFRGTASEGTGRRGAVSRRDFYGRGTRHAARRGWLAWAFRDSYSWRAILLMLSFLAFGLIVSSFVLSL